MTYMTSEELAKIHERCEKATEGPWGVLYHSFGEEYFVTSPEHEHTIAELYDKPGDVDVDRRNAAFIANARQDIPKLIAEIDRLSKSMATIAELTECDDTYDFANRVLIGKESTELPYRMSMTDSTGRGGDGE